MGERLIPSMTHSGFTWVITFTVNFIVTPCPSSCSSQYCKQPFFTWRLASGSALHVGIHEGLYRELIPMIDSVAASLEFM